MPQEPSLRINEIFHSIQGESTWSGLPCVFVRLTGCPLRCTYCDTEYAFREGTRRSVEELLQEILAIDCELVEFTGGEPLVQPAVFPLMTTLCDAGRTVLVETSNGVDISRCDPRVIRILDLKTPGSGQLERNLMENLEDLRPQDEIKFLWALFNPNRFPQSLAQTSSSALLSSVISVLCPFENLTSIK